MHELWYYFIFIWAFVDFRKKPLRARMKSGAIWAVVLVSLSTVGGMNPTQNVFLQFGACFIIYGAVAIIIYYARVVLAKLLSR